MQRRRDPQTHPVPAAAKRTRRRGVAAKTEFRQTIIETAKDLLQQDGFDSVAIRNIASRVGVTPMAFYRYFESKLEVVQCIWERTFSELLNTVVTAMAGRTTARDRLEAFLDSYIGYWCENVDAARAIFHGNGAYKGATACEVNFLRNPAAQPVLNLWEQVIHACLPKSDDRAHKCRLLRDSMFCQTVGLVYACVLSSKDSWSDKNVIRRECVSSLVDRAQRQF